jgi:cyclopropane-fatty-acyl-phospholipid synthase
MSSQLFDDAEEKSPAGEAGGTSARLGPIGMLLRAMGSKVAQGSLTIETPSGRSLVFRGNAPGPAGVVSLRRWRALFRLLTGGHNGFAEAYMDGDWESPDLPAVLEVAARNFCPVGTPPAQLAPKLWLDRLRHYYRRNTRSGSRRNIAYHYDLGNDFYSKWLDPSMTYSSAVFANDATTLEAAQQRKYERAADLLALRGGERILEIGCGWGGMAEHLIRRHGCHVTALTLSEEQKAYAVDRLAGAGLGQNCDVLLKDYRDVTGNFDRIVSIEMIEAVGEDNWSNYFAKLRDCLVPGGRAVLQAITIADERYALYRATPDFIQMHIFPGGMLPSPSIIANLVRQTGLDLRAIETFGLSYARTLGEWRSRFLAAWPHIESPKFPVRFRRMWEFYLAYCEAGFRTAMIDVGLYQIAKV